MTIGFVYWFLMLLVLLFGGLGHYGVWAYGYWGSGVILFILLALLGWKNFGAPIQKGGGP